MELDRVSSYEAPSSDDAHLQVTDSLHKHPVVECLDGSLHPMEIDGSVLIRKRTAQR